MNNIVEFPVPDRPITKDHVDKLHSQAFRDLEARLCDCGQWPVLKRDGHHCG